MLEDFGDLLRIAEQLPKAEYVAKEFRCRREDKEWLMRRCDRVEVTEYPRTFSGIALVEDETIPFGELHLYNVKGERMMVFHLHSPDAALEGTPGDVIQVEKAQWHCIQCSKSSESADELTMHSANTNHQPFYGTKADLEHHRSVLAKAK